MTHELTMKQHNDEEAKKKRTIALKSMIEEEEDENSSEEDVGDKDMALVIKKFKKFLGRKRKGFKRKPMAKGELSKEKDKEREN